ncbi:hypothetical protein SORBI_3007G090418 [Sorghum bicolor]|uniref:Uncharacterized protein n=1 Tax=Sorghum bicolor TaxID=4558 RepID=A0A1Z5R8S2_SORBI|nr:hypothetical protein SORBI_3007G090418 [Sorghum bicolor]
MTEFRRSAASSLRDSAPAPGWSAAHSSKPVRRPQLQAGPPPAAPGQTAAHSWPQLQGRRPLPLDLPAAGGHSPSSSRPQASGWPSSCGPSACTANHEHPLSRRPGLPPIRCMSLHDALIAPSISTTRFFCQKVCFRCCLLQI